MEHLSITFPQDLRKALDRQARQEKTKRSTLIQKAVKIYLRLTQRRDEARLMRMGYHEMEGETRKIMEEFRDLDDESLKYVD